MDYAHQTPFAVQDMNVALTDAPIYGADHRRIGTMSQAHRAGGPPPNDLPPPDIPTPEDQPSPDTFPDPMPDPAPIPAQDPQPQQPGEVIPPIYS